MIHLAIDGMWQVFKLQGSTPRNDFCRIAAKNGILLRLINTLYSLNEATRLASISTGGGFPVDGLVPRPRSGPLDSSHPIFASSESPSSITDHPLSIGMLEPSRASTSQSQRSDVNQLDTRFIVDTDRPQSSNGLLDLSIASKLPELPSFEKITNMANKELTATVNKERESLDRWKSDPSRVESDLRQQRVSNAANRMSTDRPPKPDMANGINSSTSGHSDQVRPLLSLLDKEPPSGRLSGQMDFVRQVPGLEKHESILPLLHASNEKKTNGELDFLMAEFAGNFLCDRHTFSMLFKCDLLFLLLSRMLLFNMKFYLCYQQLIVVISSLSVLFILPENIVFSIYPF